MTRRAFTLVSTLFLLTALVTSAGAAPWGLDAGFSTDGVATTSFSNSDVGYAMAVQGDGKVVMVGKGHNGSHYDFAVARYELDGDLDPTFSGDGVLLTDMGSEDTAKAVAIQGNGMIVVAGEAGGQIAVARYEADGDPDPTFSGDGKVLVGGALANGATGVGVQADGKVVISGLYHNGVSVQAAAFRFNSDGTTDTGFGDLGRATVSHQPSTANAIAVRDDGGIVLVGCGGLSRTGSPCGVIVARLTDTGAVDTTFSGDGMTIMDWGSGYSAARAVALQSDGKVVVAGVSQMFGDDGMFVARFRDNGVPDPEFFGSGVHRTILAGQEQASAVAVQPDGRIIAAGDWTSGGGGYDSVLARFLPDGRLDTTFDTDGLKVIAFSGSPLDDHATGVAARATGQVVVTGTATSESTGSDFLVAQIKPDIPLPFQVDAKIGMPGKEPVGEDVFDATAVGQVLSRKVAAGKKATFAMEVENDGADPDALELKGCGPGKGFKSTWTHDGSDVTALVAAGLTTATVPSLGTFDLTLVVKTKPTLTKGKFKCLLTAISVGDGSKVDAAQAVTVIK